MDSCLERLLNAITSATRGMTVEELTRHPEGKWSSAQILEHLYLTYTGTAKSFERCWEAGKPLASSLTLKQRLGIALVIKAGYFPDGRSNGRMDCEVRSALWKEDEANRPPRLWGADCPAVAEISLGARKASREANRSVTASGC